MQRRTSEPADEELLHGIHPDWLLVERVIAQRFTIGQQQYLVKYARLDDPMLASTSWWMRSSCGMRGQPADDVRHHQPVCLQADYCKIEN